MSDLSPSGIGQFLSVLRALPLWLLGGLALASYAVLFLPPFGGVDVAAFRASYGLWAWIAAVTLTILAIARAADLAFGAIKVLLKTSPDLRALRLEPIEHHSWWHLARQQDDTFMSQISLKVEAANVTDRPVRIITVAVIRPKGAGKTAQATIALPREGSPYHSDQHPVPPHKAIAASIHVMVRGKLGQQGKPIRATFVLKDQLGHVYRLKHVLLETRDPIPPAVPLKDRVRMLGQRFRFFEEEKHDEQRAIPKEWTHGGKFEPIDVVLDEELRSYASNGRTRGGLGSVNVSIQSEPNGGWTEVGKVPTLLWEREEAKYVEAPTLNTILNIHSQMKDIEKAALETYLLSHLDRRSRYSAIGYFVFLALHRMERTRDALRAAKSNLSGDKVYGYSNLLGLLAGLISHEYFSIEPSLLSDMSAILGDDAKREFRLAEKINLARLRAIEMQTGATTDAAGTS